MKIRKPFLMLLTIAFTASVTWGGDQIDPDSNVDLIPLSQSPFGLTQLLFKGGSGDFSQFRNTGAVLILNADNRPMQNGAAWADHVRVRPIALFPGRTLQSLTLNGVPLQQAPGQWPRQYVATEAWDENSLSFGEEVTWQFREGASHIATQIRIPAALQPSASCGSSYSLSSYEGFTLAWRNIEGGDVGVLAQFYPEVEPIGAQSAVVLTTATSDSGSRFISPDDLAAIDKPGWLNILIGRAGYDFLEYDGTTVLVGATASESITLRIDP